MKKKTVIWVLIIIFTCLIGGFIYTLYYRDMPEFAVSSLKAMPMPQKSDRILVLAPHPDDETLGAGGYIATAIKNGATVKVLITTNGDGERFSASKGFRKIRLTAKDYISTGLLRQQEAITVLKTLGLSQDNIIFLGYPDGGLKDLLTKNWQVPFESPYTKTKISPYTNSYTPNVAYTGENLTKDLTQIINDYHPTVVFCTPTSDLHPDHAALASFLQKIPNNNKSFSIYYYLIHFQHFPAPKGLKQDHNLTPPLRLISFGNSWYQFALSSDIETTKQNAIEQYKSQLKEPLLKSLMLGFVKKNELFFTQ